MVLNLRSVRVIGHSLNGLLFPLREFDLKIEDEAKLALVTQVKRLASDSPRTKIGAVYSQGAGEMEREIGLWLLDWEPQVGDTQRHGSIIAKPRDERPGASRQTFGRIRPSSS